MTIADCFTGKHVGYRTMNGAVAWGRISSTNTTYVFVRFDKDVTRHGWEKTTSQVCYFNDLIDEASVQEVPHDDKY